MAFLNSGPVVWTLPGTSVKWCYHCFGADPGLLIAGPDIKTNGSTYVAYDQTKERELNTTATYFVTIRNISTIFTGWSGNNLQGGGVV
jgi:hypothetical protein